MSFHHVLIAGASGGIGLGFVRHCVSMPELETLIMCSPRAGSHPELLQIQQHLRDLGRRCLLLNVDITDDASLNTLTQSLSAEVPHLDLIINASGLLHEEGLAPEKMLEHVSSAALQRLFAVNAHGPILLAKALLPWLKQRRPIVFASLSARVGSIQDNGLGGWYSYRSSKAAQNQLLKTLSIELRRRNPEAIVLALHPGTTDTALSQPFQSNVSQEKLFSPEFSSEKMLSILKTAKPADSGKFFAWDGQEIPW